MHGYIDVINNPYITSTYYRTVHRVLFGNKHVDPSLPNRVNIHMNSMMYSHFPHCFTYSQAVIRVLVMGLLQEHFRDMLHIR